MPLLPATVALFAMLATQQTPPATPNPARAASAQPAKEDPTLTADLAVLATLDKPFDAPRTFRNATAREVLEAVKAATGLGVEIDPKVVGESGGWEFARVDCVALSPRHALDSVASAISNSIRSMHLEVVAGLPIFTDESSAARLASVRHYDMRALLVRRDGGDDMRAEHMKQLKGLLMDSVNPEGWVDAGGDSGWMKILDSTLIVCATPVRHDAILKFLAGLEAALPSPTLLWQTRVAQVSPEVSDRDLAIALDSARELDALVEAKGATMLSAPKLLAARNAPAKCTIGDGTDAIEVTVSPVEGSSAFAVELKETRAGATRTVWLRAIEGVRSAGLLDAGGRRLLFEVIGTGTPPDGAAKGR